MKERKDKKPAQDDLIMINWYESAALVKHESPEGPTGPEDVSEYLDQVEKYALAVLKDCGFDIESEQETGVKVSNTIRINKWGESDADFATAASLLGHVRILKKQLTRDDPTRQQINGMLCIMGKIKDMTWMPYHHVVQLMRAKSEQERKRRERDRIIRTRRQSGEKIAALAAEFKLSERQILNITGKE